MARGERRNSYSHSINGALECEASEQRRKKDTQDMLAETFVKIHYEEYGVCQLKK